MEEGNENAFNQHPTMPNNQDNQYEKFKISSAKLAKIKPTTDNTISFCPILIYFTR
jgi:hypothetical protein